MPDIIADPQSVDPSPAPDSKPGIAPSGLKLLARLLMRGSSLMTIAATRIAATAEKLDARADALAAPAADAEAAAEDLATATAA